MPHCRVAVVNKHMFLRMEIAIVKDQWLGSIAVALAGISGRPLCPECIDHSWVLCHVAVGCEVAGWPKGQIRGIRTQT